MLPLRQSRSLLFLPSVSFPSFPPDRLLQLQLLQCCPGAPFLSFPPVLLYSVFSTLLPSAHPPAAEARSSRMTAAADATTLPPPPCFLLPLPRLRLPSHPTSSFPHFSPLLLEMLCCVSAEYAKMQEWWETISYGFLWHRSPLTHHVFPPSPPIPLFFPSPSFTSSVPCSIRPTWCMICDVSECVNGYTFRYVITDHSMNYCHCHCNYWSIQIISWSCLSFLTISIPDLQLD